MTLNSSEPQAFPSNAIKRRVRSLMGATAISIVLGATGAMAGEQVSTFTLAAQKTETTLIALAEQSSVQIMFEPAQAAGLMSPAINGSMSVEAALSEALKGTDLTYHKVSDKMYVVQEKNAPASGALPQTKAADETAGDAGTDADDMFEEIVVVGSQIVGATIADTLPVTLITASEIEATGATSFDDLLGNLPQAGELAFNSASEVSNNSRGDIASLNLRTLGPDTSLVLLNGRRMVAHPQTQTFSGVPVQFTNMNALPTAGIGRLEVLRDGASALYGSDAVAGVLNVVMKKDYEGLTADVRYGDTEDSRMHEWRASLYGGTTFNDGATNVVFSLSYYDRTGLDASERDQTRSADHRALVDPDSIFFGDSQLRNNSSVGIYGDFRVGNPDTSSDYIAGERVRDGEGNSLTSSSGQFHVQPSGIFPNDSQSGFGFGDYGLEIDDGSSTSTSLSSGNGIEEANGIVTNPLRYNTNKDRRLIPDTERVNVMAGIEHEFENGMRFFGDVIYYHSEAYKFFGAPLLTSSNNFTLPANYYWNPFGPTTLNGAPNPNRLPGIDAPEEGYAVQVRSFRFEDLGPRDIFVEMDQYRVLGGLAGKFGTWDWESALTYSESKATDTSLLISRSLLYAELTREGSDVYNVFAGNQLDQSAQAASFGVDVVRDSTNSLTTWDFKVSNGSLFSLPAGVVGLAAGVEWRRETIDDDRDERLDGTIMFTNPVTGELFESDILGVSATADVEASRNVYSGYVEAIVPLLADLPAVQSLTLQLAARYENYGDINADVMKPRIAASWYVNDWFQIRAAWSQGFRAPNLVQVNQPEFSRFTNSQEDHARCVAIGDCDDRAVISRISGNPDLKPETSENFSLGMTLQPPVVPGLTLTVDYWNVELDGTVGTVGRNDQIAIDEYLRRTEGTSNPDVVRADVTADDIAAFDGSGIDPFGEILYVRETFLNLQRREVSGVDFNAVYRVYDTPIGDLTFKFNAAYLEEYVQDPLEVLIPLIADETAAGNISASSAGDLVGIESRPEWRYNFSVLWKLDEWGAGINGRYVGSVIDPGVDATDGDGNEVLFPVDSWFTMNGYVDYTFKSDFAQSTRLRLGVRNMFDKAPPLYDGSAGYSASLHSIQGREFYMSLRTKF